MDAVLKYSDRAIVLDEGKVILDETPVNLFQKDLTSLSIDIPKYFEVALRLKKNGYKINLENVKDVKSLVDELKGGKHV